MNANDVFDLNRAAYNRGFREGYKRGSKPEDAHADEELLSLRADLVAVATERDQLKASAAEVLKAGSDLCEAVWDIGAALGADNTKDAILGRIEALKDERDRLRVRVTYLESQETYTASCDQCEAVRRLESVRQDLEGDVVRLTQDLADSRREAVERTRERDEARTEAAENMALADERKQLLTAQTAELRDAKAGAAAAWEECERLKGLVCERLKGLVCERDRRAATDAARIVTLTEENEQIRGIVGNLDRAVEKLKFENDNLRGNLHTVREELETAKAEADHWLTQAAALQKERDADSRLGRMVRAMPVSGELSHYKKGWMPSRRLHDGFTNGSYYKTPEEALAAAGVVDPLADGGGGCGDAEEERETEREEGGCL